MTGPVEPPIDGPPVDPEEWTDEQWLAWLEATDPDPAHRPTPEEEAEKGPVSLGARLTRSSGGAVLGSAMTGLAQAMYGQNDEQVEVTEAPDQPEDEDLVVHLDRDHPERSVAVVKRLPGEARDDK